MTREKLVRDYIPKVISEDGGNPSTRTVTGKEKTDVLCDKLIEEAYEASVDPTAEELGDLQEVIYALSDHLGIDRGELLGARLDKAAEKGVFERGIVLDMEDF